MLVDDAWEVRRGGALATILVALVCALVAPAVARAELFTVNSTADEAADPLAAERVCLTSGGKCTLRAAIEAANEPVVFEGELFEEFDEIDFEEDFEGQGSDTIVLSSELPAIEGEGDRINGRECPTEAGVRGPCVGIKGQPTKPALVVDGANEVGIEGLAVTGAETAIGIEGSERFAVRGSWLGVKLDGSVDGNATGVFVGPGSNEGRVGGEGAGTGNVVAGSAEDGLQILGASNTRVLGNYFGVAPNGVTPAANDEDVEVVSVAPGGSEATGTAIGTGVQPAFLATPECDGGCNLISGATTTGIDLQGDGGAEAPAVATTIAGNYIGLNASGTAPIPNSSSGVEVGKAAQTVIGGLKAGAANRVNGGAVGIDAGPAAPDLVVRGNRIGVDADGTGSLAPPGDGIVVDSGELPTTALEAAIVDNEIRMNGGAAIAQLGFGAAISGNEIAGAGTGIRTGKFIEEHGNRIEGNSIEGSAGDGILVENNLNEILGNEIAGSGGAGIRIQGGPFSFVTGNLIGGDVAADENVISGSADDAIEISDREVTSNEVARNRGAANGGLFIDLALIPFGTDSIGPNHGIQPPVFVDPAQTSASGEGAKAGASVRVFRKASVAAGELESFLGKAHAAADGSWKVVYGSAIPAGTAVAATQTSEGGTSELALATTAAGGGGGGGGGQGAGAGVFGGAKPVDRTKPRTRIFKARKVRSRKRTARFEFGSDEPNSIFLCKLDDKPFDLCKSPKRYANLTPGKHRFEVRAIDRAGNADSSPAKVKFMIVGGR